MNIQKLLSTLIVVVLTGTLASEAMAFGFLFDTIQVLDETVIEVVDGTTEVLDGTTEVLDGTVEEVTEVVSSVDLVLAAAQPVNVIVRMEPDSTIGGILHLLNGLILDHIPGTDIYLVSLPALPVVLPPGVLFIEINRSVSLPLSQEFGGLLQGSQKTPADWYSQQAALQVVNLNDAHGWSTGVGVVIASIDSRVDHDHAALIGHLTDGYDFVVESGAREGDLSQSSASYMFESSPDLYQSSASYMFESSPLLNQSSASYMFEDSALIEEMGITFLPEAEDPGVSHGTFTAGLIAVTAPEATIMPIRAFSDRGETDLFILAKSIYHAVSEGADVINMSWGTDSDSEALRSAVDHASTSGVVLVAAAGNYNSETPSWPAAYPSVIAVASSDNLDQKADFSNYGSHVHVVAPGVDIISTVPGGYGVKSGTSFSAPIVSGQVALLRAMNARNVAQNIGETATTIESANPEYQGKLGWGRVDLTRSVEATLRESRKTNRWSRR